MVQSTLTTYAIGNSGKYGSRNGARVDRFIIHHGATVGWQNLKDTLAGGGREVSATYGLGNGELALNVPEELRPFTTGAASWDARALTVEVKNATADPNWTVSDVDFDLLARLIADWAIRYEQDINDNTVLTHQEVYLRYGASYATACPGGLQPRKAELLALANKYKNQGITTKPQKVGGSKMDLIEEGGKIYLVNEHGNLWVDQTVVDAVFKIKMTAPHPAKLSLRERAALENALHTLARRGPLVGDDDYAKVGSAAAQAVGVKK